MAVRRRNGSRRSRFARATTRAVIAIATDEDTYVFGGIALLSSGVGIVLTPGAAVITAGVSLLGFGLWLGFWRLSARPGGEE